MKCSNQAIFVCLEFLQRLDSSERLEARKQTVDILDQIKTQQQCMLMPRLGWITSRESCTRRCFAFMIEERHNGHLYVPIPFKKRSTATLL